MVILDPCTATLWKITKAGDAVTCSLRLQVPDEAAAAQKRLPGQNYSARHGNQEL